MYTLGKTGTVVLILGTAQTLVSKREIIIIGEGVIDLWQKDLEHKCSMVPVIGWYIICPYVSLFSRLLVSYRVGDILII